MNIMSKLFGFNDIGIDLGSANVRVWVKDKGLVLEELLTGLDKRLADATGLTVRVADDPAHTSILGVSVVMNELDFLSRGGKR